MFPVKRCFNCDESINRAIPFSSVAGSRLHHPTSIPILIDPHLHYVLDLNRVLGADLYAQPAVHALIVVQVYRPIG